MAPIPAHRLWWFRFCAAILVPLAIIGGLELGLLLAGYGYPTSFFLQIKINGQDYYVPNDKFGYQFFPPALARIPLSQRLAVKKSPHTYRIFVLGESAAMGDPDPSYGAWRYLEVLLRERYPGTDFEVVCAAMTAIDSHVILPMARECARRDGDLWIIYMGNNEMVGPFGGSTIFGLRAPGVGLVRASLAAKATRVGQLLEATLARVGIRSAVPPSWSGLNMFRENKLCYDDPGRLRAYANFRRNLDDILSAARGTGVPVILSTVASNLKDCAPFASSHAAALDDEQKAAWDRIYQEGIARESAGNYREALERYAQAAALDPQFAELQFRLGTCHLALTNYDQARREFELARDYDTLAFRADTRINQIITDSADASADKGVYFLDAVRMLAQHSPEKIPGSEWFYEHVHLNFDGNYALGRAWAEQVAKLLPAAIGSHSQGDWASAEFCDRRLAVSPWDRERVWQTILSRISAPPHTEQANHAATVKLCEAALEEIRSRMKPAAVEQTRQLYTQALAVSPADNFLHVNFAQFLATEGDLAQAVEEGQRITELLPQMPGPYYNIGRLLVLQGKPREAEEYFSRAVAMRGQSVIRGKPVTHGDFVMALNELGLVLANQQKTVAAARCFNRARREKPDYAATYLNLGFLEQSQGKLDEAMAHYRTVARLQPQGPADYFNQAVGFAALGLRARAVESFGEVIELKPEFWQARYLLGLELAAQGKIEEARAQFLEAVRYRPDFAPAHLNLGVMLAKQEKLEPALTEFRIALQLDPTNPAAQQYLETLHAPKGRGPESNSK